LARRIAGVKQTTIERATISQSTVVRCM
jgi:hypothetical protein